MPYLKNISYEPKLIFQNGHVSTIYLGLISRFGIPHYSRKKIDLPDGDFLLLDYVAQESEKALIICHGLEGDSRKNYNNVCANYFIQKKYSVFAWNNRSCGGEMNNSHKLYHHDGIDELEFIINYVESLGYKEIYVIGFSLGGAQILNLLGKRNVSEKLKASVAISSPYSLHSSATKIQEGLSQIYLNRFIRKIKSKILIKSKEFPEILNYEQTKGIRNFDDVIQHFVIPAHGGYHDLEDYYKKASPAYAVENIKTPVLIINALNDPILGEKDHPAEMAKNHKYVFLETPEFGGHCAFPMPESDYPYSVLRAEEFFREITDLL